MNKSNVSDSIAFHTVFMYIFPEISMAIAGVYPWEIPTIFSFIQELSPYLRLLKPYNLIVIKSTISFITRSTAHSDE